MADKIDKLEDYLNKQIRSEVSSEEFEKYLKDNYGFDWIETNFALNQLKWPADQIEKRIKLIVARHKLKKSFIGNSIDQSTSVTQISPSNSKQTKETKESEESQNESADSLSEETKQEDEDKRDDDVDEQDSMNVDTEASESNKKSKWPLMTLIWGIITIMLSQCVQWTDKEPKTPWDAQKFDNAPQLNQEYIRQGSLVNYSRTGY